MLSKSKFGETRVDKMTQLIDRMLIMWADPNMSVQNVADELGIPKTQVHYIVNHLKRHGVDFPKKAGSVKDTIWKELGKIYKEKLGEREE